MAILTEIARFRSRERKLIIFINRNIVHFFMLVALVPRFLIQKPIVVLLS